MMRNVRFTGGGGRGIRKQNGLSLTSLLNLIMKARHAARTEISWLWVVRLAAHGVGVTSHRQAQHHRADPVFVGR